MSYETENADHLMARLTKMGNTASKLKKKGICTHGYIQGNSSGAKCLDCGALFSSDDEAREAGMEILRDYL